MFVLSNIESNATQTCRMPSGLREGFARDIPYPFTCFYFCMDALSRLPINAQENGLMRGIRVCQNSPRINHLFFADDALLFICNKQDDAKHVRAIRREFESVSSKQIKLAKSSLLFGANTTREQKHILGSIMGMRTVDKLDSYLGLPLSISKNKTNTFRFFVDRFSTRIKGWLKRLLSRGGKKVFLKAIL